MIGWRPLGKKKPAVTQHDFRDALEAFVNQKPVKVKRTKAIGLLY
jgi:hypothetical protein